MKPIFISMAVMFLVLMMVGHSTQLQCYTCWSTETTGCAINDFDSSKAKKSTCGTAVTECIKTINTISGVTDSVYRGCGGNAPIVTGCSTGNNQICNYSCKTDLCNGAMTTKSFSIIIAISSLLVAFLARYI